MDNSDFETLECLEEPTARDDDQNGFAQSYASGVEVSKTKATMLKDAHQAALRIRKPIEGVAPLESTGEDSISIDAPNARSFERYLTSIEI